jgi:hypothetical protein
MFLDNLAVVYLQTYNYTIDLHSKFDSRIRIILWQDMITINDSIYDQNKWVETGVNNTMQVFSLK